MSQLEDLEKEKSLLDEYITTQKMFWIYEAKLKLIRQQYSEHIEHIVTTLEKENAQCASES